MTPAFSLPLALGLTLAVELPVAAALGLRARRSLAAVALVSLLTNPLLNFAGLVAARHIDGTATLASAWPWLLAAETLVVFAEWRLLVWALGGDTRKLRLVSFGMNAASAFLGLIFWL